MGCETDVALEVSAYTPTGIIQYNDNRIVIVIISVVLTIMYVIICFFRFIVPDIVM